MKNTFKQLGAYWVREYSKIIKNYKLNLTNVG